MLIFQVFDKGVLDDAEGRQIDFRNTIIILDVRNCDALAKILNEGVTVWKRAHIAVNKKR